MTLDIVNWKAIVEALLYAAGDEGLTKKQLLSVLEIDEAELQDIMLDVKETYEKKTGASSLSSTRIRTCFRPKKNSPSI